ncbi:MAG TPA: TrmH family RNA methyltransferase [Chakrabartia sp.]|jgi:tRNA/rRNA methyltransferase|nr:TrmH family RNA methyltransferase [Chakrabartia sp.]
MAFWTYILKCADQSYYTGHTDDLERRVGQHQTGTIRGYTFERRPVELVWAESFATREEALSAEIRIKNWSRAKKEALIAKDWDRLKIWSKPPGERQGSSSLALGIVPRLRSGGTELETHAMPPLIILVRPQLGENIGKAARAMLNFGLTEMRLVAPRDGWPNPNAGPAASGADIVLENAQLFDTLEEAIADCAHVYATTVRRRDLVKPVVTPEGAAREIVSAQGRTAILFGPERSGLETDDVAVARSIITVPINPEFGSLNLAQAVILVAYEWSKHQTLASPTEREADPPAPQGELDGLIAHLDAMLEPTGYFFPPDRVPTTKRTLRSVLTKPGWNANEVRTLRGVLSALQNPHPK